MKLKKKFLSIISSGDKEKDKDKDKSKDKDKEKEKVKDKDKSKSKERDINNKDDKLKIKDKEKDKESIDTTNNKKDNKLDSNSKDSKENHNNSNNNESVSQSGNSPLNNKKDSKEKESGTLKNKLFKFKNSSIKEFEFKLEYRRFDDGGASISRGNEYELTTIRISKHGVTLIDEHGSADSYTYAEITQFMLDPNWMDWKIILKNGNELIFRSYEVC
ncbi:hypothetical protein PPL_12117 [Heterostelium album PN500]|uniref:Uncharacterized protein n=1 Tax=Heterostelium pallidum (strain ATCC 26659 / Pp 5 / PN500) TaxID=670386 RepID=D3BLR4_HETP5|nr:hypothetical protein PPL_12117 [Heterostelium album PN500]EFA77515.1 hypothetical protein PPL_12117 [Heterostelium album PN500]|eukprot:XP_020429643.1 hypothetical protein PPL_12117 [Heterostelium album PN500]